MKTEILLAVVVLVSIAGLWASAPAPLPGQSCVEGTQEFGIGGQVGNNSTLIDLGAPSQSLLEAGTYSLSTGCLLDGDQLEVALYTPSPHNGIFNLTVIEYSLVNVTWLDGNHTVTTSNRTDTLNLTQSWNVYPGERVTETVTVQASDQLNYVMVSSGAAKWVLYHSTPPDFIIGGGSVGETYGFYAGILVIGLIVMLIAAVLGRIMVERTRAVDRMKRRTVLLVVIIFAIPLALVLSLWDQFSLAIGTTQSYAVLFVPVFSIALLAETQLHPGSTYKVGIMRAIPSATQRTTRLTKKWTSKKKGEENLYRYEEGKGGKTGKWLPVKRDGHYTTVRTMVQTDTMPYIEGRTINLIKGDDGVYRWKAPGLDAWVLRLLRGSEQVDPVWNDRKLTDYPLRYAISGLSWDWWVLHSYPQEPTLVPTRFRLWKTEVVVGTAQATPPTPGAPLSPPKPGSEGGASGEDAPEGRPRKKRSWFALERGVADAWCFGPHSGAKILEQLLTNNDMVSLAQDYEKKCEEVIRLKGELPKTADEWTEARVAAFLAVMCADRRPPTPEEERAETDEAKRARAAKYTEELKRGEKDDGGR